MTGISLVGTHVCLSPAIPLWEMSSQLLGSSPWDGAFFFHLFVGIDHETFCASLFLI